MNRKVKVLVVDDEPNIRMFIRANLIARGYEVSLARDGIEASDMAASILPDLIILDINLPIIDGIEVCRRIRKWGNMPIIVLSVREDQRNKVLALNEGADDYITKPFGIEELLARIKVALRHSATQEVLPPIFKAGNLEVDLPKRSVKLKGQIIKLTPTEFKLLEHLVRNHGKMVSHSELLHNVWGPEYGGEKEYVRVFIGQLRHKIEDDPLNPRYILTETRLGYRFVDP
jgi:two-component system KDP operon response regulator KdpE